MSVLEVWVGFVCLHGFGGEKEEYPYATPVNIRPGYHVCTTYLAPMTTVLLRNIYFSNKTNMPPGNVPKAASLLISRLHYILTGILRPVNNASVTKVPNSASNRSRRGVREMMLKRRCSQLRCIKGNAFRRCTAGGCIVSTMISVYHNLANLESI